MQKDAASLHLGYDGNKASSASILMHSTVLKVTWTDKVIGIMIRKKPWIIHSIMAGNEKLS
jgi:hypothetical protein